MGRGRAAVRLCGLLGAVVGLLSASPVVAQGLESLNANAAVPRSSWVRPSGALVGLIEAGVPVQVEERLGVPSSLRLGAGWVRAAGPGTSAEEAARGYLRALAPLYRLPEGAIDGLEVAVAHDTGRGPILVRFRQRLSGAEVYGVQLTLVMSRSLELVGALGWLHPDTVGVDDGGRHARLLGPEEAITAALEDLDGTWVAPWRWKSTGERSGEFEVYEGVELAEVRVEPVRVRPVWFSLPTGLVPAWHLELIGGPWGEPTEAFGYVISGRDGSLLLRQSLDADVTFRVWADPATGLPLDSPEGTSLSPYSPSSPLPVPGGFVEPVIVDVGSALFGQGDPWLPVDPVETRGNRVDAYVDRSGEDGFDAEDYRASLTAPGRFEHVFDPTVGPSASTEQVMASIQHLFFVNNAMHDLFYGHGFDERAGNAQLSNFGRGGVEGDPLFAEAQDFSGVDNANMRTPGDGASPRMQMYLFPSGRRATASWTPQGQPKAEAQRIGRPVFWPYGGQAEAVVMQAGTGCLNPGAGVYQGKITLVDRGVCGFFEKVQYAEAGGAVGVIIANNDVAFPDQVLDMTALAGQDGATIGIPSVMVSWREGATIKAALQAGPVSAHVVVGPVPDGTLDNQIVAHEWGHYMFGRLTRGASNMQGAGLNEGNSDVVALLMALRPEDGAAPGNERWQGLWPFAPFASGSARFGLRRYPYSTDFAANPLTFKHISNGQALPAEPPRRTTVTDNAEVHNTGEVWAAAMWEAMVTELQQRPVEEARSRLIEWLVAALKATPTDTTFVEARDAVLAVVAATDPEASVRFAEAFARRGLGTGAVAPERFDVDNAGVVESFEVLGDVAVLGVTAREIGTSCDGDGVLDLGEEGELELRLANAGFRALGAGTVTISGVGLGFPSGATVPLGPLPAWGAGTVRVPVRLDAVDGGLTSVSVAVADPALLAPNPRRATFDVRVDYDEVQAASRVDDVEGETVVWERDPAPSPGGTSWVRQGTPTTGHVWYGPDLAQRSDLRLVSPPLRVSVGQPLVLTFRHRHAFDATPNPNAPEGFTFFDGAVIEASVDGGPWQDVGGTATPGYVGTIADLAALYGVPETDNNPLAGRRAWAGTSPGYPAFRSVRIGLGTVWAGRTVRLRFRVASDNATGAAGWEIDDIAIAGIEEAPFAVLGPNGGVCFDTPPTAVAGGVLNVDEGTEVTLDGTGSYDPLHQPLAWRWTQTAGPDVTLDDLSAASPSFLAPLVVADTVLRFSLVVSAGDRVSEPDMVEVHVRDLNRPPTASAGLDLVVDERTEGALDGSASFDPDGDTLVWTWSQLSGPALTLDRSTPSRPSFLAPEVNTDTAVVFSLAVSDGVLDSPQTDEVTVTLRNVNRPPLADAGPDQEVAEEALVMLDGSASADPDGDEPLTFAWTQTAGPPASLTAEATSAPTFTAPSVFDETRLAFSLVVGDGELTSEADTVEILVRPLNAAPVAVVSGEVTVEEGGTATLDGSASYDADGDALAFRWTQRSGPAATVTGADAATATLTAPPVSADMTLAFDLVVSDGLAESAPAVVMVRVRNVNHPPVADAGPDLEVGPSTFVVLDGTLSEDPDGDEIAWDWVQLGGPTVQLDGADGPTPTFAAPSMRQPTSLVFSLVVIDAELTSEPDDVRVTVLGTNRPPIAQAGDDLLVTTGDPVVLDAAVSADPDGDPLTFAWRQLDGPTASLDPTDLPEIHFVAPEVVSEQRLRFEVEVRDDLGASATDTVDVLVRPRETEDVDVPTNNGQDTGPDDTIDAGPDVDDDPGSPGSGPGAAPPGGCACSTSGAPHAPFGSLWLGVGLVAWAVWRRRS